MKILQIIESAYRTSAEEQDDTVVWLSHAMRNAGAEINLLLRNNAVNYAVKPAKEAPALPSLGVNHPPQYAEDLQKMASKGVGVYVSRQDLETRGIARDSLISGVQVLGPDEFARLFNSHDYVFHW